MFKIVDKILGKKGCGADAKADESYMAKLAVSALFVEVAQADDAFDSQERDNIVSILKETYSLSGEDTSALLNKAEEEHDGNVELWHVTKVINEHYSPEEKLNLVEMLWRIVYADNKLDRYEDYLMHKLGKLLHLTHKELIDAKLMAHRKDS